MAASVNYTLPANAEALYMLGSGLTGTGSSGADTLHSSGGPNTLVGLGGDDLYYVNNAADVVIEAAERRLRHRAGDRRLHAAGQRRGALHARLRA